LRDTVATSIRLPADLLRQVDEEADTDARTRSNMIRVLLREALERRDEARRGGLVCRTGPAPVERYPADPVTPRAVRDITVGSDE
jgi:Arc/MetJ-type ribon-helix-helix transcriptional regulator